MPDSLVWNSISFYRLHINYPFVHMYVDSLIRPAPRDLRNFLDGDSDPRESDDIGERAGVAL